MLPRGGGFASVDGTPTISAHDPRSEPERQPHEKRRQKHRSDSSSLGEIHGGSGEGTGSDGRPTDGRPLRGSSPVCAEGTTNPRLKRKRTPSRRIVEAAESALLLDEVIENGSFYARTQSQGTIALGAAKTHNSISAGDALYQPELHTTSDVDFNVGEVSMRLMALREALHQEQGQHGPHAAEYENDWDPAQAFNQVSEGSKTPRRPLGSKGQPHAAAATRGIPLCRQSRKQHCRVAQQ